MRSLEGSKVLNIELGNELGRKKSLWVPVLRPSFPEEVETSGAGGCDGLQNRLEGGSALSRSQEEANLPEQTKNGWRWRFSQVMRGSEE